MTGTKERILLTALRLFSINGYEAVSVSDIAEALNITKGALYKHYENKRDIFDSILSRMEQRDAEQARACQLPEGTLAEMKEAYASAGPDQIIAFSKAMFRYWTRDSFAAQFRRMLTIEQYRSAEMMGLYQQYLVSGPLGYLTDLFSAMGLARPREKAAAFYAPMFLLYGVCDGGEDPENAEPLLDQCLKRARASFTDPIPQKKP